MEDWSDYQTGPFCRHWCDPIDCTERCKTCGHKCTEHDFESPGACMEDGCSCKEWLEEDFTPMSDPSK